MTETEVAVPAALVTLAKELDAASKRVEQAEEVLKSLKSQEAAIEKKLVDEMITQQTKSIKIDGYGGFRTQACVYPNVTDRETLNAWVTKNKKKVGFLYTVSVNGTKLKSYVKELMENGKPIPPGVEPYTQTEIRRFK